MAGLQATLKRAVLVLVRLSAYLSRGQTNNCTWASCPRIRRHLRRREQVAWSPSGGLERGHWARV